MKRESLIAALTGVLLPLSAVLAQTTEVGTVLVRQNDALNNASSVTLTPSAGSSSAFRISGGNRGDYDMNFGNANDVELGTLVTCVAQNGRDNSGFGDSIGRFYANSCADITSAGRYYIPVNDTPRNGEVNIDVAAGYFPYDRWLGGFARNAAGTNGGVTDQLRAHASIRLGTEFRTLGSGVFGLDLRAVPGGGGGGEGVLLVTHAKNEANYATSRANTDGTFSLFTRDNAATGAANEQDPISFVYLPASALNRNGLVALGRVNGNATTDVLAGSALVSKGATGRWYIQVPGHSPETGTLLISPEGGATANFDNVVSYEWDPANERYVVESRDIIDGTTAPALQNGGADEDMFSFAFFRALKAPTVAIEQPLDGATYTAPASFSVQANAADQDGVLSRVEFLRNDTVVAVDTEAPYELSQTSLSPGNYRYVARAVDDDGYAIASETVQVTVTLNPDSPVANTALWLDGVDDHVRLDLDPVLGVGGPTANGLTLECWFRKEGTGVLSGGSGNVLPLIAKGRGQADNSNLDINYTFGLTSAGLLRASFEAFPVNGVAGGADFEAVAEHPAVEDGVWTHAAVTYDAASGQWNFYLNGQPAGSVAGTAGAVPRYDSIQPVGIGTAFDSNGVPQGAFPGLIDEVRIWNHVRTPEQVLNAWDAAVPATAGLVGRFGFDEGRGERTASSTGERREGSVVGGPVWVPGAPLVEEAPQVVLTQPLNGQRLQAGQPLLLTASAFDVQGPVAKVEFYVGGTLLGEALEAPFALLWSEATEGEYVLKAVATDLAGRVSVSESVTIRAVPAPALLITEVQSSQSAEAPAGAADYWELTNVGTTTQNLQGYTWDNARASHTEAQAWALSGETLLAPGQSLIFTTADPGAFRAWWGLAPEVAVVNTPGAPDLAIDDRIVLFDAGGAEVTSLSFAAGGFPRTNGLPSLGGHAGASGGGADSTALVWDPASGALQPRYSAAQAGVLDAAPAGLGSDLGSPGKSGGAPAEIVTTLALVIEPYVFSESAVNPAATAVLLRSGDLTQALEVQLVSSDPTAATVPETVTLPANESRVSLNVTAVNDFLVDGPQTAQIVATAVGANLARQTVTVLDDGDLPPPDLRVTEVQSAQSPGAPAAVADYFELTNFGSTAADLTGFTWTDATDDPQAAQAWALPAGTLLAPGESVIVTTAEPAAYRAWWGLNSSVQVLQTPGAPGLGQDDQIVVYTDRLVEVTRFSYAAAGFSRPYGLSAVGGHAGPSAGAGEDFMALVYDPTSPAGGPDRYLPANAYRLGGRMAVTGSDIGSPGVLDGLPLSPPAPELTTRAPLRFTHVATMPLAGAEISAYDPVSKRLFVTSNVGLQVLALEDPAFPVLIEVIDFTQEPFLLSSTDVTSVAVHNGIVAVAVPNAVKDQPGQAVFLTAATGERLESVTVGVLPDMITFTPDGSKVLTANEGEMQDGGVDTAPGSVSIINVASGFAAPAVTTVGFTAFDAQAQALKDAGVRIFEVAPGVLRAPSLDFEPEYIAVSPDSSRAMVTLQEANAVALLDLNTSVFTEVVPLGEKDFSSLLADFSDRDAPGGSSGQILPLAGQPVYGLYLPDAISAFQAQGQTYYVMANEGDDRDDFQTETVRVGSGSYVLDPENFPNAAELKSNDRLGRLNVSNAPGLRGDADGDGDIDRILAYGGRSISIRDAAGNLVYDSGDLIERLMAELGTPWWDDSRSDNKGAEPEGVVIGEIEGRLYAFAGLERARGVMVFDITNPAQVTRAGFVSLPTDLNPEGLTFVPKAQSPTGEPLLAVTNETSNTLSLFNVGRYTLQLLHYGDAEAGELALDAAPGLAALVEGFEQQHERTLVVMGGDSFLAGPFLNAGADPALNALAAVGVAAPGRANLAIHNLIGVEAAAVGHHEWDLGSGVFMEAVAPEGDWSGANYPLVSLNLDHQNDSAAAARVMAVARDDEASAVPEAATVRSRLVPATVVVKGGEKIGLLGVTTPLLAQLSRPTGTVAVGGGVVDLDALAQLIQPWIEELEAEGADKIVLLSHLGDLDHERALAGKLRGADVIVASGSGARLSDVDDVAYPGQEAVAAGSYPLVTEDRDGTPVLIVGTQGGMAHLGRLVVDFDLEGRVVVETLAERVADNGAYAATAAQVAAAWGVTEEAVEATAYASGSRGAQVRQVTEAVRGVLATKDREVLGYTAVHLEGERARVRSEETNLGNLTADAALAAVSGLWSEGVVSLRHAGSVHGSVGSFGGAGERGAPEAATGKPAGAVTRLDVESVLRGDHGLMVLETTVTGLKALLEHGVSEGAGSVRYPQVGGLQMAWDPARAVGQRVRSLALVNGGEVVPLFKAGAPGNGVLPGAPAVIRVVTLDELANGGEGYPAKANGANFRRVLEDGTLGPVLGEGEDFLAEVPGDALGEQALLAWHLEERHGNLANVFVAGETAAAQDERIQNLGLRSDSVPPVLGLDSDGDGLPDYDELLLGVDPAAGLRVGDQVDLNLAALAGEGRSLRLLGKPPAGLKFDPVTGRLSGLLGGSPGLYDLQLLVLDGGAVVRAVNLPLAVEAFPPRLLAGYEALVENAEGQPLGILRVSVTRPSLWSGSLELLGAGRRSGAGSFALVPGQSRAELRLVFKAAGAAPEAVVELTLDTASALVDGRLTAGAGEAVLRGHRLTTLAGSPPTARKLSLALDPGLQSGVDYPAGFGWAKGSVSNRGVVAFKGQLGDAQAFAMAANLGVTGQALVWVQPYKNKQSYMGGVLPMPDVGQPAPVAEGLDLGLQWFKAADAKERSYADGFGAPLKINGRAVPFAPVKTAAELATQLELTDAQIAVEIESAVLSNAPGAEVALPTDLRLAPNFALTVAVPDAGAVPWAGKVNKADGGLTGVLTLPATPSHLAGKAPLTGVLLPGLAPESTVGVGLVKVPVAGNKGQFRTASLLLEK